MAAMRAAFLAGETHYCHNTLDNYEDGEPDIDSPNRRVCAGYIEVNAATLKEETPNE